MVVIFFLFFSISLLWVVHDTWVNLRASSDLDDIDWYLVVRLLYFATMSCLRWNTSFSKPKPTCHACQGLQVKNLKGREPSSGSVASEASVLPARRGVRSLGSASDASHRDFSSLSPAQALGVICVQCLGLVHEVRSSLLNQLILK
jgi:hypothetical protein